MDETFVRPDYQENSIANIPATVASLLGVPFAGLPPLRRELWQPLKSAGRVRRVVLLLIDGMGLNLHEEAADEARWLLDNATVHGRLTSIFPSTTVAALSSLWTGVAPAQHGLVGLTLFFPEFATMGQMLQLSPTFASWPDGLLEAGLEPENFLQAPGFAEQLAEGGVSTFSLKHYGLVKSGLSRMLVRGVKRSIGTVGSSDTLWWIRRLLEEENNDPTYIMAYWSAVDTLEHMHGYDHPTVIAELRASIELIQRELWESLSPAARKETVLLVTADHGQTLTPPEQQINLQDHPQLKDMLLMQPAGEPRTAYLYTRHGCHEAVLNYFTEHLAHATVAMDAREALAQGLFGPEPHSEVTLPRLGDVVVTMRDGYVLLNGDESPVMASLPGRHGGMTAEEMQVPWFAFHLDY